MTTTIGFLAVTLCWTTLVFVALQLVTIRARTRVAVLALLVAFGLAVIVMRTGDAGIMWLRSARLRSDAVALGALVPTIAVVGATMSSRAGRPPWMLAAWLTCAAGCAVAGGAALVLGRAGWYWEFVAVIVGGLASATACIFASIAPGASPNRRIVAGIGALAGAFLMVSGTALLVAWQSLA